MPYTTADNIKLSFLKKNFCNSHKYDLPISPRFIVNISVSMINVWFKMYALRHKVQEGINF